MQPLLGRLIFRPRGPSSPPPPPGGDVADRRHPLDDGVAPLDRLLLVVDRVVPAGRLDEAREEGRLLDVQVLGRLGEVALGGCLDAVRLLPEEGDVQVVLEDALLAQLLLDLDGELQLADLAADRLLGGLGDLVGVVAGLLDEDVLHVLLGQRRGALGDAAALRVLVDRAEDALEVDRAVLVEARVLDGDDRLLHVGRDVLERDYRAVAVVDGGDLAALRVQDGAALTQRWCLEVGRQLVESLDGALRGQAQGPGGGQGDPRQHRAGDHADPEELGGLLGRRQAAARALVSHERQPNPSSVLFRGSGALGEGRYRTVTSGWLRPTGTHGSGQAGNSRRGGWDSPDRGANLGLRYPQLSQHRTAVASPRARRERRTRMTRVGDRAAHRSGARSPELPAPPRRSRSRTSDTRGPVAPPAPSPPPGGAMRGSVC